MRKSGDSSGETGMFGPETDLLISLAALLILFISIEKKKSVDETKSVRKEMISLIKNIAGADSVNINKSLEVNIDTNKFMIPLLLTQDYVVPLEVENSHYTQRFTFGETALFEKGSSKLEIRGFEVLNKLARKICEKGYYIEEIKIDGHASVDGDDIFNLELAGSRANEIFKYLLKLSTDKSNGNAFSCFNPSIKLMSAASYGEYKSIGRERGMPLNVDEARRHLNENRRVELILTYYIPE